MATVSFRMDDEVKRRFERTCNELGMSMSTAFTIFAKRTIWENGLPFPVQGDPFYAESNLRAMDRSIAQLDAGKVVVKTMEELERMENG